jgi:hypothetical protein
MALSVLVAIVLTPALCATLLKPAAHRREGGFFGSFNRGFDAGSARYRRGVRGVLARAPRFLAIFAALLVGDGLAVPAPAERVPARRGPGNAVLLGPGAGRRHAGAHAPVHGAGRAVLPGAGTGGRRVGVRRAGLRVRRLRPEHGHGLRQAARLGRAGSAGALRRGRGESRHGRPLADPGRLRLRLRAAADARARPRRGLRLLPQGQRRAGSRGPRRGARAVPRGRARKPAPDEPPPQRPAGHAAAARRGGRGAGGRAPLVHGRGQLDASHRLGRPLHRRLPRPRAGSSGSTCRPTRPTAWCRRTSPAGPCERRWRDGALPDFRPRLVGLRLAAARALQRRAGDGDQRRGRAGRELRRGDGRGRAPGGAAAAGLRLEWTGLSYQERAGRRAGAACCTRSRC